MAVVTVRGRIAQRLRERAESLGMCVEEYLVELLSRDLDPRDRAQEYVEAALDLLEQAQGALADGNVRQAAEKLWGAAALAVKAYAYWRGGGGWLATGNCVSGRGDLRGSWRDWVSDAWAQANSMHICFYEGWCNSEDVEKAYRRVERLVKAVASLLEAG